LLLSVSPASSVAEPALFAPFTEVPKPGEDESPVVVDLHHYLEQLFSPAAIGSELATELGALAPILKKYARELRYLYQRLRWGTVDVDKGKGFTIAGRQNA